MKTLRLLVLLSTLLGIAACGGQGSPGNTPASSGQIIISNGTVVDGRGSEPIRDGIVVMVGDRITFVGRAAGYSPPSDAQVIDARGGTILPGIIDSHVLDASDPGIRREFLMSGVTTVCNLGSPLEDMPRFGEDYVDEGPVARGYRSGPIITAPGGLPDAELQAKLNYEVGNPDEARAAVVDLHNRGADVIKVFLQEEYTGVTYPMLGEDELAAIVEEAHSLGLLVRAHVTYASLLGMAVQAGVDTVQHVPFNLAQSGSYSISEAQLLAFLQSDDPLRMFFTELYPNYEDQLRMMVEAGIVMVPTLDRAYGEFYRTSNPSREQEVTIETVLGIVRRFHELGGVVGLGTDFNTGLGVEAGMPVGEMEMLLAAGLTPMEVIEAGTRVSATVCGHGGQLGTLESGKLADVIVVDGDPLEDLQTMNQVVTVISHGEVAVISEGMLSAGE
ncbi:MAG: amidohydrolase family protein [Anaerolineales bacterium]|nr:MAG: amidohydrolase family protein [Anaerolineales bacterium]